MSMTHEEAARILDPDTTREALNPYADSPVERMRLLDAACRVAADVLRNKLTGEPLTMEQLREMDGQPAWCEEQKEWGIIHIDPDGMWANIPFFRGVYCDLDVKYNGLTLYAYQPAHIDREAWKPCGEMCRNNCATCDHNADEVFGDADYCKDCHRYSKWESSIHKYCERCGRPRTPDAWAELEKRIGV
ncbi:hypothetical protein B5G34_00265 [Flavonifractor sp. An82]|uniref:hypothetical protein n=1 Tax=Flavonifractor sp. An82 TaxID=1965660 RepID=UPI000B39468D|nr:hypothetical protein [Flavonifractor sp. An82]OUN23571.1 hypothetical protein B5G34_00265 [Flavonifractor sp. An82]